MLSSSPALPVCYRKFIDEKDDGIERRWNIYGKITAELCSRCNSGVMIIIIITIGFPTFWGEGVCFSLNFTRVSESRCRIR